ncbi:MAG: hypothetical protein OT477_22875 [Chloroflexi bacterium]|nr:hypothetical protein [Chloroflexota bacterium]
MKKNRLSLLVLAFTAAVLLLAGLTTAVFPPTAYAAPLETVTNLNDSGAGSLRQAIANVDPGGTINFAVSGTILLLNELVINKDLTIQGNMPITVSGNNAVRVFSVNSGTFVTLDSLTIANGNSASSGGGIYNNGTLTVNNSTLSGNTASASFAGGIYNNGTLTVNNSTITANTAFFAGGIYNNGTLTVNNSTLSGNTADYGGGIRNFSGTATIINSTITANTANTGNGGGVFPSTLNTVFTRVGNTIIAGNNGTDLYAENAGQYFSSLGYNLIGTASTNVDFRQEFTATGDITNTLPLLGALADNGGPTLTHRPNSGSLAIDNGAAGCGVTIDQRGAARPYNTNCDIGAVETHPIAENCTLTTGTDLAIGDLTFNVANLGTLACIKVEGMGAVNHLLATTGIQTGQWWHIFGENSGGNRVTSGFELTLTLPHANLGNPKVCKYPDTQGGYGWDCFRTGYNSSIVWLSGVGGFSDWAVGNDVGPTAVALSTFSTNTNTPTIPLLALTTLLLLLLSGSWLFISRKS